MTTSNELDNALEKIYAYTKNAGGDGVYFWSEKTQNPMLSHYKRKAMYWQPDWYQFLSDHWSINMIDFIIGQFKEFNSFEDFEKKIIELATQL